MVCVALQGYRFLFLLKGVVRIRRSEADCNKKTYEEAPRLVNFLHPHKVSRQRLEPAKIATYFFVSYDRGVDRGKNENAALRAGYKLGSEVVAIPKSTWTVSSAMLFYYRND